MNRVRAGGRNRTAGRIESAGWITKNDDAATTRAAVKVIGVVCAGAAATAAEIRRAGRGHATITTSAAAAGSAGASRITRWLSSTTATTASVCDRRTTKAI